MRVGTQTVFDDGRVEPEKLKLLRECGLEMCRIDAQSISIDSMLVHVQDARDHGLDPVVIVSDTDPMLALPTDVIVEFGNEPDPGGVAGITPPALYRDRLDHMCAVAAASGHKVIAPGLSNLDEDSFAWAHAVRDIGGGWPAGLYAISVHRYGDGTFEKPHRGFVSRERELFWLEALCQGKPYCVTEFGYPTSDLTEDDAAERMLMELRLFEAHGALFVIHFQLRDGAGDHEKYGIFREDGTVKPSIMLVLGSYHLNPLDTPAREATFAVVVHDDRNLPDSQTAVQGAGVILSTGQEGFTNADGYWACQVDTRRPFTYSVHRAGHDDWHSPVMHVTQNTDDRVTLTRHPVSIPVAPFNTDDSSWGRRKGATWASSLLARPVDFEAWAVLLGRVFHGRFHTQVNVMSARWKSLDPVAVWPWVTTADGRFDLYAKNPEFWEDRLPRYIEAMNRQGGIVQLCFMELYSFSDRKHVEMDKDRSPVRFNVNGIYWRGDDTFLAKELPDAWALWFAEELGRAVRGSGTAFVPFNEGPEKDIHIALAEAWHRGNPEGRVICNRNEDTPGQYWNMKVGRPGSPIDMLAYHGWGGGADSDHPMKSLRTVYREVDELPNTFEMMLAKKNQQGKSVNVDWSRIIASSDGSRRRRNEGGDDPIDPTQPWTTWRTYNWSKLIRIFRRVIAAGGNIEHQSAVKMDRTDDTDIRQKWGLETVEVGFLEEMAKIE